MKEQVCLPNYISAINNRCNTTTGLKGYDDIIVINIAYRPRPQTPAGGPNGVLALQEKIIGGKYRGVFQKYIFEPKGVKMPSLWQKWIDDNQISTMSKKLVEAHYFVQQLLLDGLNTSFYLKPGTNFHFLCHDIGSAAAAHFCGFPFTLIYHQQGSFVHERLSFGEVLNDSELEVMNTFEKVAFENAQTVYFPSNGAKKAFDMTSKVVDFEKVTFSNFPAYNTVADFDVSKSEARSFLMTHGAHDLLDEEVRKNSLIFISVGDFSENKGLDLCPDVLTDIASKSDKKVVWIAIGSRHSAGIYEEIDKKSENYNFRVILSPARLPHSIAMALVEMSDYLLMLQRYSIFDFSTLEAMKLGAGLILSPVGGNLEFNRAGNVVFVDKESCDYIDSIDRIVKQDPKEFGARNKQVFSEFFDGASFEKTYSSILDSIIENSFYPKKIIGISDAALKNYFNSEEVVICGAGKSLAKLKPENHRGAKIIALNSALLADFSFDIHMMQDQPAKTEFLSEYLKNNTAKKIYGRINRRATQHLRLDFDLLDRLGVDYVSYELSAVGFDPRRQTINFGLEEEPVQDMLGVLFSAIQLCVWSGVKKIDLAGVDFSDSNFSGKNPNKYNTDTIYQLAVITRDAELQGVEIVSSYTDSSDVLAALNEPQNTIDRLRVGESIVEEGLTNFRYMQSLSKSGKYTELLQHVKDKPMLEYYTEPRYLREIGTANYELGNMEVAANFYSLYFDHGGDSKSISTKLKRIKRNLRGFKLWA